MPRDTPMQKNYIIKLNIIKRTKKGDTLKEGFVLVHFAARTRPLLYLPRRKINQYI